ncbi:MAG: hypothetical protein NT040_19720 [Bacteroidetes bacterium]|nr:hypothetical protein [Bacteroidota bacterium]
MKNKYRILCTLIIISLFALSACKKDANPAAPSGVVQVVTTGTWRVTYFIEASEDKTSDFTSYTFSFNSNGILTASLSGTNTTGSWGWDDNSSKLHISIGNSNPLSGLTGDWLIIEKTETLIMLKNDNAAKNELLTFTRN